MEFSLDELLDGVTQDSLPDPVTYQYYNLLQQRKILINEAITSNIIESAVIPFLEMDNDGSGKPIEIIISTSGGDIYSGFALVDVIEKAKTPTTIHMMGIAASMGTLIAMAGRNNQNVKTVCHPFCVGLLHSGSAQLEGTTTGLRDYFNFADAYEKRIKDFVITHTKIDEDLYNKIERKELWLDADEMVRLGIVDEII